MAKHRKPTRTKQNIQKATTVTFSGLAAMAVATAGAPAASAAPMVTVQSPVELPAQAPAPVFDALPTEAVASAYVVQPGDWLSNIAPRFGVTAETLYADNVDVIGPNPDLIIPGQVFFVAGLPLANPPVEVAQEAPAGQIEIFGKAIISNSAGPVAAHTQLAANAVWSHVPGVQLITIGGTRGSAIDPHGHPSGNALDYMVRSDKALGDTIVQYNIDNWHALGVEYIIWQQKIMTSPGGGWKLMENRGSITANHYDHVHVNYRG